VIRALVLAIAAALALAPATQDAAPFELPRPTGPYAVGTTAWRVTDPIRRETFTSGGEPRQVEVIAWYPAAAGAGAHAPYLREGLAEARTFAKLLRSADTIFDGLQRVQTHAAIDAVPAASPRRFPTLVMSAGFTGSPSAHTALVEDLASHGYAVLNVVHPYEETAATLADGRVVSMLTAAGGPLPGLLAIFAEWAKEDEIMAAVAKSTDTAEKLRLLRGYLSGLQRTTAAVHRWVDDSKLVLNTLAAIPAESPAGRLAARLDAARLGVFGHSMGGVMAGQFCLEDERCVAGLNLDGSPQSGDLIDKTMPRPFLMMYTTRGREGANDAIYQRAARTYYRVDVPGTRHLDFCDMTFWGGPLRERPVLGSIAPARVTDITRAAVRGFFDQELRGQRAALSEGLTAFPDVSFKTMQ